MKVVMVSIRLRKSTTWMIDTRQSAEACGGVKLSREFWVKWKMLKAEKKKHKENKSQVRKQPVH